MQCHQCHQALLENSKFCKHCGTPQQSTSEEIPSASAPAETCSECGAACKPGAKFCLQCGAQRLPAVASVVDAATSIPSSEPIVEAWSAPTPPPIAEAAPSTVQQPASGSSLNPKILVGAALVAVVVAASAWMFFKPSSTQAVMAPERLHTPSGAVAEEDLAKAASIVGPQSDTSLPLPADSAAADVAVLPQALPEVDRAPAVVTDTSVATTAPVPAAAPAPKPATVRPVAPKSTNTLDGLLD